MIAKRSVWLLPGILALAAVAGFDAAGARFPQAFVDLGIGIGYFAPAAGAFLARADTRSARWLLALASALVLLKAVADGLSLGLTGKPGWWVIALLNAISWSIAVAAVALFATFPDGVVRRLYERNAVLAVAAAFPLLQLLQLLGTTRLETDQYGWRTFTAPTPAHVEWLSGAGQAATAIFQLSSLLLLGALALLVLRYRRAGPDQRRQIRWPFFGVVVSALVLIPQFLPGQPPFPFWVSAALFVGSNAVLPAALAIGIAGPRSLDVDVVIRRSAVFSVLWALIAAAYVGTAAALGIAAGQRVPLGLAVVIAIAATLLIQPARATLERLADRLVYGRRLGGYELLTQLGTRLETSAAPEDVTREVAGAVRRGLGATWVRVLLNRPEPVAVCVIGLEPEQEAAPVLAAPLVHAEARIGELQCGPRAEGKYGPADEELLRTLGRQAALAIRNSQLTTELSERLEELAASRTRLVQAEEAGRRRLERDLHDGVQQELVGLLARLGLVKSQVRRDAELAERTIREAHEDARRALENLQDLARGIHPAVLTDRGLIEAVEERASRLTLPVDVCLQGVSRADRFAPDVEGAAYFVISEALTNVVKHAGASRATVRFSAEPASLAIQVEDDGSGLGPSQQQGSGLRGLKDRLEALGGSLRLGTSAAGGTLLVAELPVTEERLHA